jgi:Bifunctional DNA primase/polymerase, N-terminal/Primase C terminal 1 (PriCT-1)
VSNLAAALQLAQFGLPVLPLHSVVLAGGRYVCTCGRADCQSPGKHPHGRLVRNGLKDATTDQLLIGHWWGCFDYANVGIATGAIVVLDVDPRHDGDHTLRQLEDKHGPLPTTWRTITGGSGEHVFFSTDSPIANSTGTVGQGLDVRGTNGYVVAPPSLHESGRTYAWNVDFHPDDVTLAPIPAWLADLATGPSTNRSAVDWNEFAVSKIPEGTRNASLAQLTGHLLRRYVDPGFTAQLALSWNQTHCEPPLSDQEVLIIVRSIATKELRRREAGTGNGH